MADIEMCSQTLCPNAKSCYRVRATTNPYWQSYVKFQYKISTRGVECYGYWPMLNSVVADSTAIGETNGSRT